MLDTAVDVGRQRHEHCSVDFYLWTHHVGWAAKDLHSSYPCGYWVPSRGLTKGYERLGCFDDNDDCNVFDSSYIHHSGTFGTRLMDNDKWILYNNQAQLYLRHSIIHVSGTMHLICSLSMPYIFCPSVLFVITLFYPLWAKIGALCRTQILKFLRYYVKI